MQACVLECEHLGIPARLHWKGRPIVASLSDAGRVYMYYPAIADDVEFDAKFDFRGLNQSVISDELNVGGGPSDVFWDTRSGVELTGYLSVCFPVSEIRKISFPDVRIQRKDPKTHQLLDPFPEDYVGFDVIHDPVPCMYPHCEVRPMKGGFPEEKFTRGMNNIARERFAAIANRYRSECVRC